MAVPRTNKSNDDSATLGVVFMLGVSLSSWKENGILARESAIYNELAEEFDTIYLYTYGDRIDLKYEHAFADNVVVKHRQIARNRFVYSFLLPFVHWQTIKDVDVLKTDQMKGSWTAVFAKLLWRSCLVVRTGYVYSRFQAHADASWLKQRAAYLIEAVAYGAADGIITTSKAGYDYVEDRYHPTATHEFIPNYIETDIFRPDDGDPEPETACTVCRLVKQKNLDLLIEAIAPLDVTLSIAGSGPLRESLERLADEHGADVEFVGRIDNSRVPEFLNRHAVFVLPSAYEGMPKALLEAMACGRPVVATDVEGNREVVTDETNGLLCAPTPDALRSSIERLLNDAELRDTLEESARETIESEFSLEVTLNKERRLYRKLVKGDISTEYFRAVK